MAHRRSRGLWGGGGGGYAGGNGGNETGFGGSSYDSGQNPLLTAGVETGNGLVTIATTATPEPASFVVWALLALIGPGFLALRKKYCGA